MGSKLPHSSLQVQSWLQRHLHAESCHADGCTLRQQQRQQQETDDCVMGRVLDS